MEARWLFDVSVEKIQVLVHPQSIVHSAVEFIDGAVIAQMGMPDMKLPIQYALFYPDRRELATKRLRLTEIKELTFEDPDPETFRGFALALIAAKKGGSLPTIYNAANERAVRMFLDKKIGFLDIAESIEFCMNRHQVIASPGFEEILMAEQEANRYLDEKWGI